MDSTHSQTMSKPLKINLSIPFHKDILFLKNQFHNELFSSNESVSKGPKHSLIYQQNKTF
jgi:hypothetical protein